MEKQKTSFRQKMWPDVTTPAGIRIALWHGCAIAIFIGIWAIMGTMLEHRVAKNPALAQQALLKGAILVGVMFLCAWGIKKGIRTAAFSVAAILVADVVLVLMARGKVPVVLVAILAFFIFNGIRGTVAFQRAKKQTPPPPAEA